VWLRSKSDGTENQSPTTCSGEEEECVTMLAPFIGRIELRRECNNEWLVIERGFEKRCIDEDKAREQ
jgi:hypothetical protein